MYKQTTQIPNIILDHYLRDLSGAELKILLVIVRQTYGWIDPRTGYRKERDRISRKQFILKTGLCRRIVSQAIQTLLSKGLITISCQNGNFLNESLQRRGLKLYYELGHLIHPSRAQKLPGLGHESDLNKTNYTKLNKTKLRERGKGVVSVGEVIAKRTK